MHDAVPSLTSTEPVGVPVSSAERTTDTPTEYALFTTEGSGESLVIVVVVFVAGLKYQDAFGLNVMTGDEIT